MKLAIGETQRRRQIQLAYNVEHDIDPQTIKRKITDILQSMRGGGDEGETVPRRQRRTKASRPEMPTEELERLIASLEDEMHEAAKDLRFEYAARIRDEVHDLRKELKALREAGVGV